MNLFKLHLLMIGYMGFVTLSATASDSRNLVPAPALQGAPVQGEATAEKLERAATETKSAVLEPKNKAAKQTLPKAPSAPKARSWKPAPVMGK